MNYHLTYNKPEHLETILLLPQTLKPLIGEEMILFRKEMLLEELIMDGPHLITLIGLSLELIT